MIVPMQHVTLLCLGADRRQALDVLARLGVLHVEATADAVQSDAVKTAEQQRRRARAALDEIKLLAQESGHKIRRNPPEDPQAARLDTIIETAEALNRNQRKAERLRQALAQWQPFGHFDPGDVRQLSATGLPVRLFRCEARSLPALTASTPNTSESGRGSAIRVLHQDAQHAWGVQVGGEALPAGCQPLDLPEKPTAEIEHDYQRLKEAIRTEQVRLLAAHHHLPELYQALESLADRVDAARAWAAMGEKGPIAWLTGFCPAAQIDILRQAAAREGWGLSLRDPRPNESVPTLVRRPNWLQPVKAVFDVLGIHPGYREADISGVFLVFFTVFFAMLVGDAGYGAIVLAGTLLARRKLPRAPRYPFAMLTLLGLATLAWGILSGNYFGIAPERIPGWMLPPAGLMQGLRRRETLMQVCFLIGAVHLTLAHLWNGLLLWPSRKTLAQLGWVILVWCMYYTACGMVLQTGFPALLPWAFIAGVMLVVLFMTNRDEFRHKWIDHAMLPLTLAGCLVDVISYIRLYAVGVATLQVAESFNTMALSFEMPLVLRLPVVALVLLLGHALNLALCGLSILVHAVRLNTLEFSQHKGLEWAGFAYRPFCKRRHAASDANGLTSSPAPAIGSD